jgi:hypothetical protein
MLFFLTCKNSYNKYREASILVMTSRTEDSEWYLLKQWQWRKLLYDCPCGPKLLFKIMKTDFIQNGNIDSLFNKWNCLLKMKI